MSLPKVLIVGQTFNSKTGGGITQSNLFSGWDKDKLAVACTAHLLADSNYKICDNYYQLGKEEHKWMFPFNYLQKNFPSGVKSEKIPTEKKPAKQKNNIRRIIIERIFYPFLKYTGLAHCTSKIELSEKFCNWLNEFKPDIIYSQGRDRERILFNIKLQSYLKKPLIFHMMDDWPSTISDSGLFKKFWKKKIDKDLMLLFEKAAVLMSISDDMAEAYKKRYKKTFITFHNPIDLKFWKSYQKNSYEITNSPKLLYAGKISLGVDSSLQTIAKAVSLVNKELEISLKFVLQTKEKPEWVEQYTCIEHSQFVAYENLPQVFSAADFLILPYDFSERSIKYVRYSMPTKAPEYMISGTPILVFAPGSTSLANYANQSKWACVISDNNYIMLANALKELISDINKRKGIGEMAKLIAEKKYDAITVRNQFATLLTSLVPSVQ